MLPYEIHDSLDVTDTDGAKESSVCLFCLQHLHAEVTVHCSHITVHCQLIRQKAVVKNLMRWLRWCERQKQEATENFPFRVR